MNEQPTALELLQAVADFLREEAMPRLSGITAFHARVAANVVDIVRRELSLGPPADAAELAALQALLGQRGTLAELNGELAARIARGELGPDSPGLLDHLLRVARDKLAVDQPGYSPTQS